MYKKKLAFDRNWLLNQNNLRSCSSTTHPLIYWANESEIWHNPTDFKKNKNLLSYMLKMSSFSEQIKEDLCSIAEKSYNLHFLVTCLGDSISINKNKLILSIQHCVENTQKLEAFLIKNDVSIFYESLNKQPVLQEIFCNSILNLSNYDQLSGKLCSISKY